MDCSKDKIFKIYQAFICFLLNYDFKAGNILKYYHFPNIK